MFAKLSILVLSHVVAIALTFFFTVRNGLYDYIDRRIFLNLSKSTLILIDYMRR